MLLPHPALFLLVHSISQYEPHWSLVEPWMQVAKVNIESVCSANGATQNTTSRPSAAIGIKSLCHHKLMQMLVCSVLLNTTVHMQLADCVPCAVQYAGQAALDLSWLMCNAVACSSCLCWLTCNVLYCYGSSITDRQLLGGVVLLKIRRQLQGGCYGGYKHTPI